MKNKWMIAFLVMLAGVLVISLVAPWWAASIWIIAIATVSKLNRKQGIFAGVLALGFAWLAMAFYMSIHDNANIITKTAELLKLSKVLMFVVTSLIALITGLLSGWLGSALGDLVHPVRKVNT
ncbi:MAG: hypothetical protein ABJC12_13060 [Saprospiraceae bacterium]